MVFPAYAGVILLSPAVTLVPLGVPRVCGGDPIHHLLSYLLCACSPRMRG